MRVKLGRNRILNPRGVLICVSCVLGCGEFDASEYKSLNRPINSLIDNSDSNDVPASPEVETSCRIDFRDDGRTAEIFFHADGDAIATILARHRRLETIALRTSTLTTDGICSLGTLPALKVLKISGVQLSARTLSGFADFPQLVELDLGSATVSGRDLRSVRFPRTLRSLMISGADLDGEALSAIAAAGPDLDTLSICLSVADEVACDSISRLSNLKKLSLTGVHVNRRWLEPLSNLKSLSIKLVDGQGGDSDALVALSELESLAITSSKLTETDLQAIGMMANLSDLDLRRSTIEDQAVKHLQVLRGLQRLNLSGTTISDIGVRELSALRYLRKLDLSGTRVSGDNLGSFEHAESLVQLSLNNNNLSNDFPRELRRLRNLKEVYLRNVMNLGSDAVDSLRTSMPLIRFEYSVQCCGSLRIDVE